MVGVAKQSAVLGDRPFDPVWPVDVAEWQKHEKVEEDLAQAQRLAAVELSRLSGTKDYNVEEFRKNMLGAIDQGRHSRLPPG